MKKFFLCASNNDPHLEQAAQDLRSSLDRDDVIERSLRKLEQDETDDSVGFGGFPNLLGVMELDAAFMDGNSRNCGSVAGVTHFLPVRIARLLMKAQLHTFLQGAGAEIFARDCGLEPEPTLSDAQRNKWQRDIEPLLKNRGAKTHMDIVRQIAFPQGQNLDTSIMIAGDGKGMSGAATTAGWPYKHPGRVGDAPIIGAGLYVDSRFGGSCSTYTGEMSTRTGMARFVVTQMSLGKSPREAVHAAIEDVSRLRGGLLQALVVHATDPSGLEYVAAINAENPVFYQYWHEDLAKPERRKAEAVSISFPQARI